MEILQLNVETRQTKGKERAGRMRRAGKVPGVFYATGKDAAMVTLDAKEFRTQLSKIKGAPLVKLASPTSELNDKLVILKEVQQHPVSGVFLHADFFEIDESKPLQTSIPLHFVGKAQGVIAGGALQTMQHSLAIECLPRDLPPAVEIDVSELGINDAIRIADLNLPDRVEATEDDQTMLVIVQMIRQVEAGEEETRTEEGAEGTSEAAAETEAAEAE